MHLTGVKSFKLDLLDSLFFVNSKEERAKSEERLANVP